MAAEAKKKGNQTAKAGKGPEQKEKTTAKKNMARSGRETTGRMEGKHFLGKNRMKIRRIGEEDVFRKKYQSVPKGGEENGH